MQSLDAARNALKDVQRETLDFICSRFLESGKSVPVRQLFHKFDRAIAEPAIEALGGRVVWRGYYDGKDGFQPTLLGIALSLAGSKAIELLVEYLKLVSSEYESNPELPGLQSAQIGEKLSLNTDDLRILGLLVAQAGGKFGLSGGGPNPNGDWYGSIGDHADELRRVADWNKFVAEILLTDYDQPIPVGESARLQSLQVGNSQSLGLLAAQIAQEHFPEDRKPPPKRRAHDVRGLPNRVLQTYSRLWQLETWLRLMVYVELRAFLGDGWTSKVKINKAEGPLKADKALIHMPSPEEDPLSYAQLYELRRIITENRSLFDSFLPPEKIWDARMDEIAQVRHRVAHFRLGNEHDLDRVAILLRDVDKSFWKFCTSYNDQHSVLPQSGDPVVLHFLPMDLLPWKEVEKGKWGRVGTIPHNEWFGVTVETTMQPWAKWALPIAGQAGFFYDVTLSIRGSRLRHFDYTRFLESTRNWHKHFAHVVLSTDASSLRLTIPAILGEKLIVETLEQMIEFARTCVLPNGWPSHKGPIQELADAWPEYVLMSDHAFTMLTKDMPCSIFEV